MQFNKVTIILSFIILVLAGFGFYSFQTKQKQQIVNNAKPRLTINDHTFSLELARSSLEQQKGLSDRDSLPQNHGMLFLFEQPQQMNFWMKDMRFPIDIIFIRDNVIISVAQDVPPPASNNANLPTYKSEQPADKVLEINAGLSRKYNIKKGDTVTIEL